jgi:hypothetical protein
MARFKGGSGSPANGGGFSMVLQRSGPSRDVRGRLNRSKTHRRVALTGRGGGLAVAVAWIPTRDSVLEWPEWTGGDRGWCSGALRCLEVEESREKLEFATWGRKLGRGGVGGLNRRENQCGGDPAGAAMGHSHDATFVCHERRQDVR